MIRLIALAILIAASLPYAAAQGTPSTPAQSAGGLPNGPGKAVVQKSCTTCHSETVITSERGNADHWSTIVNDMVSRGADLSDDEIDVVVKYLSTNLGPADSKSATPASPGAAAPPTAAPGTGSNAGATVNVNKAGVAELESSLGLTEAEAKLIVQHREQSGNFKTWQEVSSIPGVSPEKIRDNQQRITF
jgi:competence protein ComEA